ncbi:MAG TPA: serine/threonine-protein kinase [Gemmatimonadaceae bacterium]|nr:serine/threonine-protein kinase [Gemmatimonadaceae bacterium]
MEPAFGSARRHSSSPAMALAGPPLDPLFLSFQAALAGRYSIDRELGRGGMGIVYLAREVHLDRLVAIKLLPPDKAEQPALRERFLREARVAAKLSHPNIIPIHAVEETGGFVFYVMAYVDGETLAQRVRTRGPLSTSDGTRVLREVAWALAHAHEQGLVHRDVKPDNILLEASTGRVLVADFGIAAVTGDAGDGVSGTPEFMSPEQALGTRIDARSDLYGLGITAFYAFSGRLPFEGKGATEVLAKQISEAPPPLASLGLTIPRKLAALIDRCLSKEAEHRPASAQVLAEQLGVALEQRRELPAALRAFVRRNGRLNGGGTLIAGASLLPVSTAVAAAFGGEAGFVTFALGLTAAPFAYLVHAARKLTRLGFAHRDLAPAFQSEVDQAREELTLGKRAHSAMLEKGMAFLAKASGALGVASAFAVWFGGWSLSRMALPGLVYGFATSMMATTGWLALRQRHRDIDTDFWSKLWMGRIGRLAFGVARKLPGRPVREVALTHRATELSLGMAAEQLFESLPKETRRSLGDLPALLRRLQDDAQRLRARYDELQEVLADAGDAAGSDVHADLRDMRDSVQGKLAEAVGALETIRLNLLRLHAGSTTVEGLTTHLGIAEDVSEQVERLIAAHREVERQLQFPRLTAPTPA